MINNIEKIARILRIDKKTVESVASASVLDKIVKENDKKIKEKLEILDAKQTVKHSVFNSLLDKAEEDDKKLPQDFTGLLDTAKKLAKVKNGFFLKEEKARELLLNTPPRNVKFTPLEIPSLTGLTKDENLFEVFASLRFVEDNEWMNKVFFKQYENLTPDDFEERPIKTIVLGDKWTKIAEQFLKEKYHNVSHLKELGVIFILPATMGVPGESLRTLSLALHYYYEIDFYSKLFRKYARGNNFAKDLTSSLRGDVLDKKLALKQWMIIQQYLTKHDKNDWRLAQPHVNPEAIHYKKSEDQIAELFDFWKDLDWVGDFFEERFVSFNLSDIIFSLVRKRENIKYLYHHQEALWNKIFAELYGDDKMEEMVVENWEKGYIQI